MRNSSINLDLLHIFDFVLIDGSMSFLVSGPWYWDELYGDKDRVVQILCCDSINK